MDKAGYELLEMMMGRIRTVIPALAWGGGLGAALAIGALAGLLPALRAARLSPTDALRTV